MCIVHTQVNYQGNSELERYSRELQVRSDSVALDLVNWSFSTEVLEQTWSGPSNYVRLPVCSIILIQSTCR